MPRVVPSVVCGFIDSLADYKTSTGDVSMNLLGSGSLNAILDLIGEIPDELLTMDGPTYGAFIHAKAYMREVLQTWIGNNNANAELRYFHRPVSKDPIALIRRVLSECPDNCPAPATSELNFITDSDLRTNLRIDIGAASRALSNGEWKAATVLAGSAIEALLLWRLLAAKPAEVTNAAKALHANRTVSDKPTKKPLDEWDLHDYIEVANHLKIITKETTEQARLAKHFRNLIHPGRVQRLRQKCTPGTAHASFAALDLVVTDLS